MDFKLACLLTLISSVCLVHTVSAGLWGRWQKLSECDVVCGYGLQDVQRICIETKNSTEGCFAAEGKPREKKQKRLMRCAGQRWLSLCKMTMKETLYSIQFKLRFSSSISSQLFNRTVAPVISETLAMAVTKYCNENPKKCCKDSKQTSNSASRHAFVSASNIHFTSDSPHIVVGTLLKIFIVRPAARANVGIFVVPPKDTPLCGKKGVVRRRRSVNDVTDGALSKVALLSAAKTIQEIHLTTEVSKALLKDNKNITVSFVESFSAVKESFNPNGQSNTKPLWILFPVLMAIVGAIAVGL